MTDAESQRSAETLLRERAHALANMAGTCHDLDYRRVFRHSDGCNAIFDELRARDSESDQLREENRRALQRVADLETRCADLEMKRDQALAGWAGAMKRLRESHK